MAVFNARNYKLAKICIKDIQEMLTIIDAAGTKLVPYARYKPAQEVLHSLRNSKTTLTSHLKKARVIVDSKGAVEPEGEEK